MKVENIPWALFKEFKQKYGTGEVRKVGSELSVALLDPAKTRLKEGCRVAIGLQVDPRIPWAAFYVLYRIPESDEWPAPRAVEIVAGPANSGVWAIGRGEHVVHRLKAELDRYYGLDLIESPAAPLAIEALARARELASAPELERESYWEVERRPGTYEEP